jgi:hypothetical protein
VRSTAIPSVSHRRIKRPHERTRVVITPPHKRRRRD